MSREVDLAGTVAVVTGGGGGIGGAVSDVLAAAGAHVVVVDIDDHLAEDRVAAITAAGHSAEALIIDVRRPDDVERLASTVLGTHGRADVLVNNVGHYLRPTAFVDSDRTHWSALHDVNLAHVFACSHAFLPAMIEQGDGSIVNVSSVEGLRGYPPDPVYGAYKAAVVHFTRCLALEVAPHGVRVNAIAPDVTQSMQVDYEATVPEELKDRWPVWVPIGRVGQPEDSADVVLFLASPLSRFVTGHVIPTDGGTLAAGGWFRTMGRGRWTNRPRNP
ncbi:MAG: 3-oxoacyl-[acyl-carrier-protein] reductase [Acidimicrobiales bacterium]|nr:3-oxoacyl-[acyl-carrier-protein] reductase [Acidimicrobiales bacterium]